MTEQVRVDSTISNDELRQAILDAVESAEGTQSVESEPPEDDGIAEVVATIVVIAVVVPGLAYWVADVFYRIRQRFRPMLVLDLTQDTPKVSVFEEVPGMRGEIVVKQKSGEEVTIKSPESGSDLVQTLLNVLGLPGS